MAKKVRQRLRSILDYAVEGGLIVGNPIPAPRRRKAGAERAHLPATLARDGGGRDPAGGRQGRGGEGRTPRALAGCVHGTTGRRDRRRDVG